MKKRTAKVKVLVALLIVMLTLVGSNYIYTKNMVIQSFERGVKAEMQSYSQEALSYMNTNLREVEIVAQTPTVRSGNTTEITKYFQQQVLTNNHFVSLDFIRPDGIVFTSGEIARQKRVPFDEALTKTFAGDTTISRPFKADGKRVIAFRAPVYDNGQVIGVVSGLSLADTLFSKLEKMNEMTKGDTLLVDAKGQVIDDAFNEFQSIITPHKTMMNDRKYGMETIVNADGENCFFLFNKINGVDLALVILIPEVAVIQDVQNILIRNALTGFGGVVIVFGLIYWGLRTERRAEDNSMTDSLTELPNRSKFDLLLNEKVANKKITDLAVAYIDLDRFKVINDVRGYEYGDHVLKRLVEKVQPFLTAHMELFRIGGDEFAIIATKLPDCTRLTDIGDVVRLHVPLSEENDFLLTASIGISYYPSHGDSAAQLLRAANMAVMAAKESGRGVVRVYDPSLAEEKLKKIEMEQALRKGIARGEFELYYQPQVSMQTRKLVGMEALIRWNSRDYGFVSPMQFIPLAEETGFINELGYWTIEEACHQVRKWEEAGIEPFKVSVNISPRQFMQLDFYDRVVEILQRTNVNVRHISFEITETTAVENVKYTNELLAKFAELGILLAIDDFGTGYSSLSLLQQLKCHILKIDRSFIVNAVQNVDSIAIVSAVISIAHHLKMQIIAEGVETEEQWQLLEAIGCDMIQGYLVSKPVPSMEVPQLIERIKQAA